MGTYSEKYNNETICDKTNDKKTCHDKTKIVGSFEINDVLPTQ